MSRSITRYLFLLIVSAAVVSVAFGGGEKLRYKMSKGITRQYTIISDTKSRQQVMGQDMASTSWSMFGVSFLGEDSGTNGEIVCIAKVDTNISRIDSPMMKDTARVLKEINNKRMRLTISPLGKTLKTEQLDTIPKTQATQMMRGANPLDILRRLFVELPEKEIGTGGTWKHTAPDTSDTQGFKIITKPDITFTVAGNEAMGGYDCVKITFEGTSSQYGTGSQQGMELVIDGTTKTKGTLFISQKDGLMVSLEQKMDMDTNISGTGEQMFTMTQTATTLSNVNLVK